MAQFADLLDSVLGEAPTPQAVGAFERAVKAFDGEVAELARRGLGADRPDALRTLLGDDAPWTVDAVKQAFRRMALATHPDRPGGSHEAFLRTTALFETALAGFSATSDPPPRAVAARALYAAPSAARSSAAASAYA